MAKEPRAAITGEVDGSYPEAKSQGKKGLLGPFVTVCISATAWLYGASVNIIGTIKTVINSAFGATAQTAADSSYQLGSASASAELSTMLICAAVFVVIALIGIVGLFTLLKRLFTRR